jgi:hypothetical protein
MKLRSSAIVTVLVGILTGETVLAKPNNVYTDPKLLDVRGALNVLPVLPLGEALKKEKAKATGTLGAPCQNSAYALASVIALKTGKTRTSGGTSDHDGVLCPEGEPQNETLVSGQSGKRNGSQSTSDHEPASIGATGFEPATSWTQTSQRAAVSAGNAELIDANSSDCTPDCTRDSNMIGDAACGQGVTSEFAAALTLIAKLPLSDAEKADAVRQLLNGTVLKKEP